MSCGCTHQQMLKHLYSHRPEPSLADNLGCCLWQVFEHVNMVTPDILAFRTQGQIVTL